jgi:hypothetical protein
MDYRSAGLVHPQEQIGVIAFVVMRQLVEPIKDYYRIAGFPADRLRIDYVPLGREQANHSRLGLDRVGYAVILEGGIPKVGRHIFSFFA